MSFLTAKWRWLAMLNFEVDPEILVELVPSGTELDLWQDRALVSMVGFRFLKTKVLGVPVPFHRDFDEVNLRFYVTRKAPEGIRRGVVFVKEIVPRAAIAWVARRSYNENYVALPMRHSLDLPGPERKAGRILYEWRFASHWNRLAVDIGGSAALPSSESEAAFITEHHWGYSAQSDGSTLEYQVEHPPWKVWQAENSEFDCDVSALYGAVFDEFLANEPISAFVAEGSEITVHRGVDIS